MSDVLRVALIGAGEWAQMAHIPAFQSCTHARITAVCDQDSTRSKEVAKRFGIPENYTDHREIMKRNDIDIIDIAASAPSHFSLASDAIDAGKNVLCEKPLTTNFKEAQILSQKAITKGVKTKMGFTFRYSPVIRRMKQLIIDGFIGTPYHFNGFIQNSQFLEPLTPFRWNPSAKNDRIMPGSLEEYAPHLIDLGLWLIGDLKAVIGYMKNVIPARLIRDSGKIMPINIEDSCLCLGEFRNGCQATFASSFISIGNYPGVEIRIYGSEGALVSRLVDEHGVPETLRSATTSNVGFVPVSVPVSHNSSDLLKGEPWERVYFRNLVQSFVDEIMSCRDTEGNFVDGAKTQEVSAAIYRSHLEKRWIELPID